MTQRHICDDMGITDNSIFNVNAGSDTSAHHQVLKPNIYNDICKGVISNKLLKLRHLVIKNGINHDYLQNVLFPKIQLHYHPQTVQYNGGRANIKQWNISCYLEVMENGIPTTEPNLTLLQYCTPLLNDCNEIFLYWYQQQHPTMKTATTIDNNSPPSKKYKRTCRRLMTFITRYTSAPREQALLKHVDGAGKVDGSMVIALPIEEPYETNYFVGGGLTFWDGPKNKQIQKAKLQQMQDVVADTETKSSSSYSHNDDTDIVNQNCPKSNVTVASKDENTNNANDLADNNKVTRLPTPMTNEIHYDTRSGDIAFIDRAVWHQADPITRGTRWALVIFYKVEEVEVPS